MTIKALIPVRSGSQRVVNKNMRPFANSSLLEIKIKQMLRIPELDGVVVNSNDDEMLDLARSLGAETVKRPEEFVASNATNSMYKFVAETFTADTMVYANCTSPCIKDETVRECIKKYREISGEYDSLNTANDVKEFLWKDNKPINYDPANTPRSQDLPDILMLNFAISIIDRQHMVDIAHYIGKKPYIHKIDREDAIDVDDMLDFEFAEFVYRKQHNLL